MKTAQWVFCAVASLVSVNYGFSAGRVVLPKKDSVAVYQNETLKTPLFRVSLDDRLMVIKNGKDCYLVKNRDGRQGWIEKTACAMAPRGTSFGFDSLVINNQWDRVTPLWVPGDRVQDDGRLFIDRSFKGELVSNLDLDEMEKRTGK